MVSYEALLQEFWGSHDPTRASGSTQYRSAVYCEDEAQRARAEASRDQWQAELGAPVRTEIFTGHPFHAAEANHQKWRLRRCRELWSELQESFRDEPELLASATAAKLNGLVGKPDPVLLAKYLDQLGLSEMAQRILSNGGR